MRKRIFYFFILFTLSTYSHAMTRDAQLTNTTNYNYNYMYPYMNNQMRTNLNPGVTPTQNSNLIDTVVKTTPLSTARRVIPRNTKTSARAGATATATAGTPVQNSRRVVARRGNLRGTPNQTVLTATDGTDRSHPSTYTNRSATPQTTTQTTERISSTRCLADYTECMNGYCQRENTAYNRCYCSSKLSQIDSEYQPAINELINQILSLKSTNRWTGDEMNEYWMNTIGKYSGENSWTNLENALNIDWASMESRVRGQNAFNTGHEYCVQHLRGCYYMAGNLRDAYKSEIARDCSTYEQSLQKIKNAAESIIGSYK
ncbi:MAG: hypothetical protein IIV74_00800 [Alphaproteobacteria bacterium]|nr:hypothetical protein [Alphaproteobacteria bacterium]